MEYQFNQIEKTWQTYWQEQKTYAVTHQDDRPKYYVLDMFPYPSGAGLHVGHPLGYIASDILSRYKMLCGFNVLHPMGYDAFGLPAEQYAIQTGQHPAVTTQANIRRYRQQLDQLGFAFDWSREIRTCDPDYYRWTQWAFVEMFKSWYCLKDQKAKPIEELKTTFAQSGNTKVLAHHSCQHSFDADQWNAMTSKQQKEILLDYRIAYLADTMVNWCPELGTVLANDEVKDGLSERGGHPVEQKKMQQWSLRISAYAQRLLDGLESLDWSESIKDVQRNWIGRSEGAQVRFAIKTGQPGGEGGKRPATLPVFTTRPDTLFGVNFIVVAPESEWVDVFTSKEQRSAVDAYLAQVKTKSERDRIADVKNVSGVFSGGFCVHPFTGKELPVWIADYVLAGYGTGAIMAVPGHDERDHRFAKHFELPITSVIQGLDVSEEVIPAKKGRMAHSDFLNGLEVTDAISAAIKRIEEHGAGEGQINFRLRDAIFSRQRYWGEPIPIAFSTEDGMPEPLDSEELPLVLPEVDAYLPTEKGEPPLGRAKNWQTRDGRPIELSTMPGFAGSSAYFLRYMDPENSEQLVSREANDYWRSVDFYLGGSEHATGHLIYARFWNMFLHDIGVACEAEPFKKLVNQGMIQGRSNFVYRKKGTQTFVSKGRIDQHDTQALHVDVNLVHQDVLDIEAFRAWRPEFAQAEFILEDDGSYLCGHAVEKMSKSKFNVVNPEAIIAEYGADTLRLYEMFLGPLEQSKPWNTHGIEGVHRFIKKLWRLFFPTSENVLPLEQGEPTAEESKVLHTCIKKVRHDIENTAPNTAVSALMICVNDLTKLGCRKRAVLEPLVQLMAPFTPHLSEELWQNALGHADQGSVFVAGSMPEYDEAFLVENTFNYPVSLNGKLKFLLDLPLDLDKAAIEKAVLEQEKTKALIEGKTVRKMIVVPKKIVNIVAN